MRLQEAETQLEGASFSRIWSLWENEQLKEGRSFFEPKAFWMGSNESMFSEAENKQCETSSFVDVKVLKDELSNIIGESMTTGGSGMWLLFLFRLLLYYVFFL